MGVIFRHFRCAESDFELRLSFCRSTGHAGHGGHDLHDGILSSPYLLESLLISPIFHRNEGICPP